jgi:hypothetical protein
LSEIAGFVSGPGLKSIRIHNPAKKHTFTLRPTGFITSFRVTGVTAVVAFLATPLASTPPFNDITDGLAMFEDEILVRPDVAVPVAAGPMGKDGLETPTSF